jgi:prevent-host-death family protein
MPAGLTVQTGTMTVMTRQMTATELKAKILSVLDEVGHGETIEITKHGRTIARLVPAHGSQSLRRSMAGVAATVSRDEDLFSTDAPWELS